MSGCVVDVRFSQSVVDFKDNGCMCKVLYRVH